MFLQHFISLSFTASGFISWIKWEASIESRLLKAVGFFPLLGERVGGDLFPSSCYPDGEMQTDLCTPEGVIVLTTTKHVSLFLNVTCCFNKKQVCRARRQLEAVTAAATASLGSALFDVFPNKSKGISKVTHNLQ